MQRNRLSPIPVRDRFITSFGSISRPSGCPDTDKIIDFPQVYGNRGIRLGHTAFRFRHAIDLAFAIGEH